ncbi:MAG: GHKL domain-containing protein [Lachnospiraceae bacterium]|jgi:two-component system sensor histidine kinase AgrC|nr:GHKL domain-containing protein [Lachnospiraceae bacterium]
MFTLTQRFLMVLLEILCCALSMEAFAGQKQEPPPWEQGAMLLALAAGVCFVFPFTAMQFPLKCILDVGAGGLPAGLSSVFSYLCRFWDAGEAGGFAAICAFFLLQQLLSVGAVGLCMAFCFQIRAAKAVCLTGLFQVLLFAADLAADKLYIAVFHRIYLMRDIYHTGGSLVGLSGRCALFFFLLLAWRIRRKSFSARGKGGAPVSLGQRAAVFALCALLPVVLAWKEIKPSEMERLYFFIVFAFLGLAIATLYLLDGLLKREGKAYNRAMFHIKAQGQAKFYRTLSEDYEKQQKKVHEYKNQILCIESLLRRKMYPELEAYVQGISGSLGRELDNFQTNHPIADAVINRAYQEMLEKDILFVPKISDLSGIWVSDGDLVAVLSNLLENAIEACAKCRGRRMIKMKLVIEGSGIVLSLRNTYEGQLAAKDGEFKTTKEAGAREHGIGLKNVMEVVGAYGGSYVIQTEGGEFYIAILIPM